MCDHCGCGSRSQEEGDFLGCVDDGEDGEWFDEVCRLVSKVRVQMHELIMNVIKRMYVG